MPYQRSAPTNGTVRKPPPAIATLPPTLATKPLAAFWSQVNWGNTPPPPVVPGPGSQTMHVFLAAVNWRNQAQSNAAPPPLQGNPQSLETLLSEFVWD